MQTCSLVLPLQALRINVLQMLHYNLNIVQKPSPCSPSSGPSSILRYWDQVGQRVRGCDDVMAVSLRKGLKQRAKQMSHGSFFFFFLSPYSSLNSVLTFLVFLFCFFYLRHTTGGVSQQKGLCRNLCPYMDYVRLCSVVCQECWKILCMFSSFVC